MAGASISGSLGGSVDSDDASPGRDSAVLLDRSEAEATRRAHSRDEAYVWAVGRMNDLYASLFGLNAASSIGLTYLHLTGRVGAECVVQPRWLLNNSIGCLTAILALIAGFGLRRLNGWALGAEALFSACALLLWAAAAFAGRPNGLAPHAAGLALFTAVLIPLLNLWDVRESAVFTPEYRRIIAAMPSTRIRARLPWELKVPAILSLLIGLIIGVVVGANPDLPPLHPRAVRALGPLGLSHAEARRTRRGMGRGIRRDAAEPPCVRALRDLRVSA